MLLKLNSRFIGTTFTAIVVNAMFAGPVLSSGSAKGELMPPPGPYRSMTPALQGNQQAAEYDTPAPMIVPPPEDAIAQTPAQPKPQPAEQSASSQAVQQPAQADEPATENHAQAQQAQNQPTYQPYTPPRAWAPFPAPGFYGPTPFNNMNPAQRPAYRPQYRQPPAPWNNQGANQGSTYGSAPSAPPSYDSRNQYWGQNQRPAPRNENQPAPVNPSGSWNNPGARQQGQWSQQQPQYQAPPRPPVPPEWQRAPQQGQAQQLPQPDAGYQAPVPPQLRGPMYGPGYPVPPRYPYPVR